MCVYGQGRSNVLHDYYASMLGVFRGHMFPWINKKVLTF